MKRRGFVYIILAGILWGSSGLFVDAIVKYGFSSLQITAARAFFSALIMFIYIMIRNREKIKVKRKQLLFYFFAGTTVYATAAFHYAAMQASSVSTGTVLLYTAPAIVMIFSVLFLGEKFGIYKLVSLVLTMVGCCLVSGIIGGFRFSVFGILLGLLAGISYSAYNIVTKLEMRRNFDPITSTFYGFLFMSIFSVFPINLPTTVELISKEPIIILLLFVCLAFFTCFLPYFLYTLALRDLPVGTASALAIIEPMSATLFSVVFLGEVLNSLSVIGIIMILSAVFLLGKTE